MRLWIDALLSPEPIMKGSKDKAINQIMTPPKFTIPSKGSILPPSPVQRSMRSRASRSVSPSKIATPSRKMASPRKSRSTRSSAKTDTINDEIPRSGLAMVLENGTTESVVSESVDEDAVRVEVTETVETNGNVETTITNVKIDMPANAPELPLPESTEDMIAKAQAMVAEASKLDGKQVNGVKPLKRKADDIEVDEDEIAVAVQPAKKVKVLEEQVKKDTVTRKAMFGIGALVAIGATIPYFM